MKFNKKAEISETDKSLFILLFVLPICGLLITLIFIVMPKIVDAQTTISPDLQQRIYMSTTIGSPLCFAYEDETINRVYNGYVDLNKITEQRLHDCVDIEKRTEMGFFVSVTKNGAFIKEIHTKNVLSRVSARSTKIDKPVIIIDGDEKYNGFLTYTFY